MDKCMQSRKANYMGCDKIAKNILHTDDPTVQKSQDKHITGDHHVVYTA